MTAAETSPRGYATSKQQLLVRLARIEGQVRGVARMVQADRPCMDVLTQLSAVEAALDKVSLGLLDGHARVCLSGRDEDEGGATSAQVDELMSAVGRMLGR